VATTTQAPDPVELARIPASLGRAEGVELLGPVRGTGYREGAALVRRLDGQMVQLGPLMYAVLEAVDGRRDTGQVAQAASASLGRTVTPRQVERLSQKLAAQGLLAGTEHAAPPRRNPLLALRWKVLVTNPCITERLAAPFTVFFTPWIMWPTLAAFGAVFWFVFIDKGVASATAEAFNNPTLLLLVFALAVVSAGIHEIGHAAACRYGGATPGGMGMGIYLVWPAFYTDVTDAYRLPRRSRLRVDLAGLYFNALVADATMVAWLVVRKDALLLLVALQVLQMVKQLSPMIRADGYHILADATGVPDLYAHLGPTLKRLLPRGRREPSALTGWARLLVTLWVLIIVPILVSLMLGAVLLLPKLLTSAWDSARHLGHDLPHLFATADVVGILALFLHLLALVLPVLGSILITQRIVRVVTSKLRQWSDGSRGRRRGVLALTALVIAGVAWAWWPAGQYQPVRASEVGTLTSMVHSLVTPERARPAVGATSAPVTALTPGTHLAASMIPVGGATRRSPALFVIAGADGRPATAIVATSVPGGGAVSTAGHPVSVVGRGFPFVLTSGDAKTSASATGTTAGGTTYDVAYSLVTVSGGAPVTPTNSASATGKCAGCTTVAVSFQVVLVVGQSNVVAPINEASALNSNCPACATTAIADQMVVTLKAQPPVSLERRIDAILSQLNLLPLLGPSGTPTAVAAAVNSVQQQVQTVLNNSGLLATPDGTTTTTGVTSIGSSSADTSTTTTSAPPGTTTTTSTTTSTTVPSTSTTTSAPSG